jgi:hypothetical protein
MAAGRKTGGRVKGTPNRRTQAVAEKLASLDCDPISAMARIAQQAEEEGDKSLAARLYTELAPYTAPKRKAIETTNMSEFDGVTRESLVEELEEAKRQLFREFDNLSETEKQELRKEH